MQPETHHAPAASTAGDVARRHHRALFSGSVTLRHLIAGGVRVSRGIALDLSESGLGALVEGSLSAGDTVALEVVLPDCELKAVAIVRHSSNVRSGFEFLGLTPEERLHIANFVGSC